LLAKRYRAKFVQDFRDLWPELFVYAFSPKLRWLARAGIQPLKWLRRYATRRTDALISVTHEYLAFAKQIVSTVDRRPNEVIYFGVDPHVPDVSRLPAQRVAELTREDPDETWFVYGGTLGDNYDIRTVLETFAKLAQAPAGRKFRLNIAGDGPLANHVREAAARFPEVIRYFGPLSKDELWLLLLSSDVGLLPYAKFSTVSVPAKTFDYIAAGLAIINSLPGEVESIVAEHALGRSYEAGSTASLAAAITEMMEDRAGTLDMKARSRAAAPKYSQRAQYAKLPRLIAQLGGQAS
jgi:glycosyltransferase involved in cell wall biosynthesis